MAARKRKSSPAAVRTPASAAVSPLDVMLGAMRELWARAEQLKGKPRYIEERLALIKQASGEAHKAAVYVHPRIASVEIENQSDAAAKTDTAKAIGSRELARRLLFAIAVAENLPAVRGGENFPEENS